MALFFKALNDGFLKGFALFIRPCGGVTINRREHICCLFTAHDSDTGIGPHKHQARIIGPSAHAVISCPVRAANNDGEFRYFGASNSMHHFGAVLGNTARFGFGADHKACNILQEDKRDITLSAELYEMRTFKGGFRKEHAIITEDADLIAVNFGKAADQRIAIFFLKFMEARAVSDARNNFAAIIGLPRIFWDDAVKLIFVIGGWFGRLG